MIKSTDLPELAVTKGCRLVCPPDSQNKGIFGNKWVIALIQLQMVHLSLSIALPMVVAGGKEYRSRSFNTDFTYGLELGMGLTNWDCLLLNLVTVSLMNDAIARKWDVLSQSGHFTGHYIQVI